MQGTVRKAGNRIRVSVQLSDSSDGRSVWGTSYDRDLTARGPLFIAAALGQLGRTDEAQQQLEELRAQWSRTVAELRQELIERHAFSPGLADHLLEGLAKAGLEV